MSRGKLDVYSHFLKFRDFDQQTRVAFRYFLRQRLIAKQLIKEMGKWVKKDGKLYCYTSKDRSEIRFHINVIRELRTHMISFGVDIDKDFDLTKHDFKDYQIHNAEIFVKPKFQMYDYQLEILEYILSDGKRKILNLLPGGGKGLRLDAPVKIPNGWKPIGDLRIGDIVSTPCGDTTKVSGIYESSLVPFYNIKFQDGREIDCCQDHQWKVHHYDYSRDKTIPWGSRYEWQKQQKGGMWEVMDTKTLHSLFHKFKSYKNPYPNSQARMSIPLISCERSPDKPNKLLIPPYTLGVILGDGTITNRSIRVIKPDIELFELVESDLKGTGISLVRKEPTDRCPFFVFSVEKGKPNPISESLEKMGLLGKRAWEKFIPEEYLNGSFKDRRNLLRGLLDTDGSCSKNGAIEFSTTSEIMAKQVQDLARGVGARCKLSSRFTYYKHNGEKKRGRESYRVRIIHQKPSDLFSLTRKKQNCLDNSQYLKYGLRLGIRSVEPCGNHDMRCIEVEHPSKLYITKDYIVTHNTAIAFKAAELMKLRMCITVLPKYKDKWVEDVHGYLDFGKYGNPKKELLVIDTVDKLIKYLDSGVADEINIIIMTLTTLRGYIDRYREAPEEFIAPEDIWKRFNIGFRVTDETHEHFHFNYMLDLFTHCPKTLYLSATLDPSGTFEDKMYRTMFPKEERLGGDLIKAYTNVKAVMYHHLNPMRWRCQLQGHYSHVAYEANFTTGRQSEFLRQQYFDLIYQYIKSDYLEIKRNGQKAIIFFSTIKMCTLFVDYLKDKLPKNDIRRYVGEDDYEDVLQGEIVVSTIGSAGTAIDIPGLILNIMTISIDSKQANLQVFGRLRELKQWPGQYPTFVYLVGEDIGKPMDYHERKRNLLKDRARSYTIIDSEVILRK